MIYTHMVRSVTLKEAKSPLDFHAPNLNCGNFIFGIKYEAQAISDDDSCGGPIDLLIGNPLLGSLADNGGPGMTHAIQAGSPAINTATKCAAQVDQRYVARDTTTCDLGAFEFIDFTTVTLNITTSASVNQSSGWLSCRGR